MSKLVSRDDRVLFADFGGASEMADNQADLVIDRFDQWTNQADVLASPTTITWSDESPRLAAAA